MDMRSSGRQNKWSQDSKNKRRRNKIKKRHKNKEFRKLTVKKEIEIARIVEKK